MLVNATLALLLLSKPNPAPAASAAHPFSPFAVRLLPSPFSEAMDVDHRYLLSLDPLRLLHNVYQHSGLPTRGKPYGGWEQSGLASHSLGHYMSACAAMYAATGDEKLKDKVALIVDELERCQNARSDGFITGIPDAGKIFDPIAKGVVNSKGFDLNGGWSPWYTVHKLFAGLEDAFTILQNKKALKIARRLGDWAIEDTKALDDAGWQKMLSCEHGGMNESLANLSELSGEAKYMDLAHKFYHKAVLDPLAERKPGLNGKHGNTQIPKAIGAARIYELTGDEKFKTIAAYFWDEVTQDHTYANGGNTMGEHFGPPKQLRDRLSVSTTETCNTYNMLKLTEHLYAWDGASARMDYYERALYNHILASQNHTTGMFCYFVPLVSGANKVFSDPENTFTCCHGTGMENHAKYNEAIYWRQGNGLNVNLYIPSTLDWKERGVTVRLETRYPDDGAVKISFQSAKTAKFPVRLRVPGWVTDKVKVSVNGEKFSTSAKPGDYVTIDRTWSSGDRIEYAMPMSLRSEPMPDAPDRFAVFYGPTLLAGVLDGDQKKRLPVLASHSIDPKSWVRRRGAESVWTTTSLRPSNLELRPFYTIQNESYCVYFDRFDDSQWKRLEAEYRAKEEEERDLKARTLDTFQVGEMQPERDHHLLGEKTSAGTNAGRKWRHAENGGWFSFEMSVDPSQETDLYLTFFGGDRGRTFDLLVDGEKLATITLKATPTGDFYETPYKLPIRGKSKIIVKLQAQPNGYAGGLYGARTIRAKR